MTLPILTDGARLLLRLSVDDKSFEDSWKTRPVTTCGAAKHRMTGS
jgi:hypothetical protein